MRTCTSCTRSTFFGATSVILILALFTFIVIMRVRRKAKLS